MRKEDEYESVRDEGEDEEENTPASITNDIDGDTIRIMISTDNHLGYEEKDPIRGNDSFAAFEEVLHLAKRHRCDMVLLAGDLFHDNKPSRRTMYRAMDIIRRYCLGPDPVQFHIISDQKTNFRSTVHGVVNFEDPHYSVDLPIFAIHGNHDDPTRDGGSEMLAPLDLLAISNMVNYFGRQDEVDKVVVSPVMIQKGSTRLALYGIGSMRDERFNRMWTGGKVRFLEPEQDRVNEEKDSDDEDEDENKWFHILALHQNRDTGRGSKNCVHEKMIPDFFDLVVWGHEHECRIFPDDSVTGTFRITQPGSSVATSLSFGEAVRKNVGILDIRGTDFRIMPIPLTQVRSFEIGEVSLQDTKFNPLDPMIDDKIMAFLAGKVEALITAAREKTDLVLRNSATTAGIESDDNEELQETQLVSRKLKYQIEKPQQVLVRLKVEHSGFTSINNQRFGARFVDDVANTSDILLFHRKRTLQNATNDKKNTKRGQTKRDGAPVVPVDLDEIGINELIQESLETANAKLEVLDEERLALALDEFVEKEVTGAFDGTVDKVTATQHKKLIQRGSDNIALEVGDENKVVTSAAVREICSAQTEQKRVDAASKDKPFDGATKRQVGEKAKAANVSIVNIDDVDDDDDDDDDDDENDAKKKPTARGKQNLKKTTIQSPPKPVVAKMVNKPIREAANAAHTKLSYKVLSDDDLDDSDDYDSKRDEYEVAKSTSKGRRAAASSTRTTSSKRKATSDTASPVKKIAKLYDDHDSDVEDNGRAFATGRGWGTANSQSQVSKRARR